MADSGSKFQISSLGCVTKIVYNKSFNFLIWGGIIDIFKTCATWSCSAKSVAKPLKYKQLWCSNYFWSQIVFERNHRFILSIYFFERFLRGNVTIKTSTWLIAACKAAILTTRLAFVKRWFVKRWINRFNSMKKNHVCLEPIL